jgi:hypothetical protein
MNGHVRYASDSGGRADIVGGPRWANRRQRNAGPTYVVHGLARK